MALPPVPHAFVRHTVSVLCCLFLLTVSYADTEVLYRTGFEEPHFIAGQPVSGQQNWIAGLNNNASPAAGVISTHHPRSGEQCLQVNGSSLDFTAVDGLYEGVYRPNIDFDLSKHPLVLVQADVRLDGPMTGPPISGDLYSANLNVYNKFDDIAEMWISSDGHVYSFGGGTYYAFSQPIKLGRYYRLAILLDFLHKTNGYYLNGDFLGSLPMTASIATNPLVVFNLANFGVPDFGTYRHGDYISYFDNVRVAKVHNGHDGDNQEGSNTDDGDD